MAKLDINFVWHTAAGGYRAEPVAMRSTILTGAADAERSFDRLFLVPVTSEQRQVEPIALHNALYLELAMAAETPEACAEFASRFGLLRRDYAGSREPVDFWLRQIGALREAVEIALVDPMKVHFFIPSEPGSEPRAPLPDVPYRPLLRAWPVPAGGGQTVLQMRPVSLIDALWLQFLHSLSEDREIASCARCGAWFERGTGTDRGRKARYCTDKCRVSFHNERRVNGGSP
jgi:hypothetical protein